MTPSPKRRRTTELDKTKAWAPYGARIVTAIEDGELEGYLVTSRLLDVGALLRDALSSIRREHAAFQDRVRRDAKVKAKAEGEGYIKPRVAPIGETLFHEWVFCSPFFGFEKSTWSEKDFEDDENAVLERHAWPIAQRVLEDFERFAVEHRRLKHSDFFPKDADECGHYKTVFIQ